MLFYIVITQQREEKETENKGEGQISNSNFIKNRLQFSFHKAILFQTLYIKKIIWNLHDILEPKTWTKYLEKHQTREKKLWPCLPCEGIECRHEAHQMWEANHTHLHNAEQFSSALRNICKPLSQS